MSKNKKQNPRKQVFMSPEKQIRQKSRKLPIVKCSVNKGWEDTGMASILIARRHGSGKLTFCTYLVDTNCMGVKDTLYWFNEPQETLREYEKHLASAYNVEEISYDLAHNIIFAAVEFAEEYGFKPHRNFTSVTQYFLEEDDDRISPIDIHCGDKNGEPFYVNNGYETPELQQRILNQLEKSAGKGHYSVHVNANSCLDISYLEEGEFEDEDSSDDIYNRWYEKFEMMDDKEFIQAIHDNFSEWVKSGETEIYEGGTNQEFFDKMRALTDILSVDGVCNSNKAKDYCYKIISDLDKIETVDAENVPNSLFPTFVRGGEELTNDFMELFMELHGDSTKKEVQKSMAEFVSKHNDCGAVSFLKLMFNGKTKVNKRDDIEKELKRFPDYFLLQLIKTEMETDEMPPERTREELLNLAKGRTLTTFEMSRLLLSYAISVFEILEIKTPERLEKLTALDLLFYSRFAEEKCDYTSKMLFTMVRFLKINKVISVVVDGENENGENEK
jgi:hypothetical protein